MKKIEATAKTPEIIINEKDFEINISGVIIPENLRDYFVVFEKEIFDIYDKNGKITLNFYLNYFNTIAAKHLYELFKKLRDKKGVSIKWFYNAEDEDIYESGIELQELAKINFELIAKD